jgi:hypothetical protein
MSVFSQFARRTINTGVVVSFVVEFEFATYTKSLTRMSGKDTATDIEKSIAAAGECE